MNSETRLYSAGEAAEELSVSKDTLRHYERIGLLIPPERTSGGYRQYTSGHLDRVRTIRRAVAVGFSLEELNGFLATRDSGGAPCRSVYRTLEARRDEVERKLMELTKLRDDLDSILADWRGRLEGSPDSPARLLDSLSSFGRNS